MMNEANEISRQTLLYGYIGEHAGASRISAVTNRLFKESAKDAMMIPMNIREDDFYFTLSNMKNSQVSAAYIANEYIEKVPELLDNASMLVKRSGACDLVFVENKTLRGELICVRAISEKLKDLRATKIAMIGVSPLAKAFSFLACGFNVSYFHDNLEELLAFSQELEIKEPDLNRIASGMEVDLNAFDAVLYFADFKECSMISALPKTVMDMNSQKHYSAMRIRAAELGAAYLGADEMIEELSKTIYTILTR
ncbi:MAG: hypothetical protein IE916_06335 [Epsilonproteobacteria bacterium]|nr:hypothetical protein [Campylobacterota bacterium]